jgi:glycosyltransferase involved in cell wall biosynthesis
MLSGPEKVARRLFDEFALDPSLDAEFVEYFFDGVTHSIREKIFGYTHPIPGNKSVQRSGIARMVSKMLRWKPDVIAVVTYERFAVVPVLLAALLRIPVLIIVHGVVRHENARYRPDTPPALAWRDRRCERFLFRHAQVLVFLSTQELEIAQRIEPISDDRIALLPNAVDERFFSIERGASSEEHKPLFLLFATEPGRPEKGWVTLAEALNGVDADVEVTVITAHEMPAINNARVHLHRVAPQSTAAFAEMLRQQDCIVVASGYEPFSLVAVEAMAAGLAAVLTRETGMSRFARHGESALLFDAGDAAALRKHIETLAGDRAMLQRLSTRGRDAVRELTWPNLAAQYRALFEKRCSGRGRAG